MKATMNDEFNHKFEDAQLEKMLQILNKSFDTHEDVERYKISYAVFNAQMREGALVMDHVLYKIKQIEYLSKLGFLLHKQLNKDAILNLLPSHTCLSSIIIEWPSL